MKEELADIQESIRNFSLEKKSLRSFVWISGDNFEDSEVKPAHPRLHPPLLSGPGLRFVPFTGDAPRAQAGRETDTLPLSRRYHRQIVCDGSHPTSRY